MCERMEAAAVDEDGRCCSRLFRGCCDPVFSNAPRLPYSPWSEGRRADLGGVIHQPYQRTYLFLCVWPHSKDLSSWCFVAASEIVGKRKGVDETAAAHDPHSVVLGLNERPYALEICERRCDIVVRTIFA